VVGQAWTEPLDGLARARRRAGRPRARQRPAGRGRWCAPRRL